MKKVGIFFVITSIVLSFLLYACTMTSSGNAGSSGSNSSELIIQENEAGFLNASPGTVGSSKAGYTGTGYIQNNSGIGANINWSVRASTAGTYKVSFRYAFGGTATNYRDANIVVNGVVAASLKSTESGGFTYTSSDWATWNETKTVDVTLKAGDNHIRLEATYYALANIDYIKIAGAAGLSAGSSSVTTYHYIRASVKTAGTGTVSLTPVKDYYAKGESVTANATAGDGYAFSAWQKKVGSTYTGLSSNNPYTFNVTEDLNLVADFTQSGIQNPDGLIGYATVQNDSGLAKVVTGGSGGTEVIVTTLDALTAALTSDNPMIVTVSGLITTPNPKVSVSINVKSNKTIKGDNTGHLKNIELKLAGVENIIIRNLTMSEVIAHDAYGGAGNDCIVISGSRFIWIDHCEFYSDLNAGGETGLTEEEIKDYYDGLLDIKNASSFITVSWCIFRDHWKAILISSGDGPENEPDAAIRVTFHHNLFKNCATRLPLIRFGKAHIFNNYYLDEIAVNQSCVNSRNGAEVFVEKNYFKNMKNTIGFYYDTTYPTGYWNVSANLFDNCTGDQPTTSTCSFTPPYSYTAENASAVPSSVLAGAGVGKL